MLRSVPATVLAFKRRVAGVVSFYSRRQLSVSDGNAGVQERLDAVQFFKSKVEPVVGMMDPDVWQLHSQNLDMIAKDPALLSAHPQYNARFERLLRVYRAHKFISSGGVTACEAEEATVPADEHSFSHAEFPGYEDSAKSVLRMVDNEQTLVQRRQLSGLCYMHAPAVVQYYAIWHTALNAGNATPGHGMLDLTHDIASHFSPLDLANHVLDDKGGSSSTYLTGILQPGSKIKPLWIEDDHRSHLRDFGPALVAGFKVRSDFLDKDVHKHYEEPAAGSTNVGLHAMVLVGARVDDSGNRFYLLQNWWAGKQFVEMSHEYLAFCDPLIQYVVTPQTGVPSERHTHAAGMHFAETEAVLEKAERLPMEMARSPVRPAQSEQLV